MVVAGAWGMGVAGWLAAPFGIACGIGAKVGIDRFRAYLRQGRREPVD